MENLVLELEGVLEALEEEVTSYSELSFCPSCERVIPSKVTIKEGFSYLWKRCPFENMEFESLLEKIDEPFEKTIDLKDWPHLSLEIGQREITEKDIHNIQDIQNLYLLLTSRCNSDCKICVDRCFRPRTEMDIGFIKEKLRIFENKQIYLTGGEPTVREDLFHIIKVVKESKNTPALITNGLKLADRTYLKKLKARGLRHVYLSFDGFDEEIYERLRGGRHEYRLKIKALENLKKENTRTTILSTLVKKINDNQIRNLLNFAKENNFISEVSFRPLYLGERARNFGFDRFNLISQSEINESICKVLGLSSNYLKLFYDTKLAAAKFLKRLFTNIKINIPRQNHLYLKRNNGEFQPLLTKEELKEIAKFLSENRWPNLIKLKYLKLLTCLVKNMFLPSRIEQDMFKMGVFRISLGQVRSVPDTLLSERINEVSYGPKGIVSYYPD